MPLAEKTRDGEIFGSEIVAARGQSCRGTPFHLDHGPETLAITAVSACGLQPDQRVLLFQPVGGSRQTRCAETTAAARVVGQPGDIGQIALHGGRAINRLYRRPILGIGGRGGQEHCEDGSAKQLKSIHMRSARTSAVIDSHAF